jgi:hypothetical protein
MNQSTRQRTLGMPLVLLLLLLLSAPSPGYAQADFKREPCFESHLYNQPGLPDSQVIGMMSGHPFRKGDGCVPFDLVASWEERYAEGHDRYTVTYRHHIPGALWYRKDKKDFVLHANEVIYKGTAGVQGLTAKGRTCVEEKKGVCKKFVNFNTGDVEVESNPMGGYQGVLFYGPPTEITDPGLDEEERNIPAQFMFNTVSRIFRKGDSRWRPSHAQLNNGALAEFDYEEFVLAAVEKRPLTKVVTWDHDEDPEEAPTYTSGKVTLRFIFDPPCPETLLVRSDRKNYVFSDASRGTVVVDAEVIDTGNFPTPYLEDVEWDIPELQGTTVQIDHPGGAAHKVRITYTGLPKRNDDLGVQELKASVFLGSKCGTVKGQREVRLFFPRDAKNNPKGTVPNWYYYWQQTKAGHGTTAGADIRFGGGDPICSLNKWWMGAFPLDRKNFGTEEKPAWALLGRTYVLLCDFAKAKVIFPKDGAGRPNDDFYIESRLPVRESWSGIDTFGVVTLHELTHRKHWTVWWSDGGNHPNGLYPEGGYYDRNGNGERDASEPLLDSDGDHALDSEEPSYAGAPHYLDLVVGKPKSLNLAGDDMTDEHIITYSVSEDPATGWKIGAADAEDWAKPGKQWKDE